MYDYNIAIEEASKTIDTLISSEENTEYKLERLTDLFSKLYNSFADDVKSYIRLCEPIKEHGEIRELKDKRVEFIFHNLLIFLLHAPNELTDALYKTPFIANAMPGISTAEVLTIYQGTNRNERPISITSTAILNTCCMIEEYISKLEQYLDKIINELKDNISFDTEAIKDTYIYTRDVLTAPPVDCMPVMIPNNDSVRLILALLTKNSLDNLNLSINAHKDIIINDSYIMTTNEENRDNICKYMNAEIRKGREDNNHYSKDSNIADIHTEYNRGLRYPVISSAAIAHIFTVDKIESLSDSKLMQYLKNATLTNYTEAQLFKSTYKDFIDECMSSDSKYFNGFCDDINSCLDSCEEVSTVYDHADADGYKTPKYKIIENASNYLYTVAEEVTPLFNMLPDVFFYLAKGNVQPICIIGEWQNSEMFYPNDFPSSISVSFDNCSIYNGTSTLMYIGNAPYGLDKEIYNNALANAYFSATFDIIPHNIIFKDKEISLIDYLSSIDDKISSINDGYGVILPNNKTYEYDLTDKVLNAEIYEKLINEVYKNKYINLNDGLDLLYNIYTGMLQVAYDVDYPESLIGYGPKDLSLNPELLNLIRELCNVLVVSILDTGEQVNNYPRIGTVIKDEYAKKIDNIVNLILKEAN